MKNKFKIDGLWIPFQILTDKNLRYKEKIIYSFIVFFSNKKGYCSIRNKYLADMLNRLIKGRNYLPEYSEALYANL